MENYSFDCINSDQFYYYICKIGDIEQKNYSFNYEYTGDDLEFILDCSKEKAKELEKELKEKGECRYINKKENKIYFVITHKKFLLKEKEERKQNIEFIKKEIKEEKNLERKNKLIEEAEEEILKLYSVLEELAIINLKEM